MRGEKVTLQREETRWCDSLGAIILINYHGPPFGPSDSCEIHEIYSPLPKIPKVLFNHRSGLKSMICIRSDKVKILGTVPLDSERILLVGNLSRAQLVCLLSTPYDVSCIHSCFCGQMVGWLGTRWLQIATDMAGSWLQLLTKLPTFCFIGLLILQWLDQPSLHDDKSVQSWILSFDEYLKLSLLCKNYHSSILV